MQGVSRAHTVCRCVRRSCQHADTVGTRYTVQLCAEGVALVSKMHSDAHATVPPPAQMHLDVMSTTRKVFASALEILATEKYAFFFRRRTRDRRREAVRNMDADALTQFVTNQT